jgi:hypothetical protein
VSDWINDAKLAEGWECRLGPRNGELSVQPDEA